MSQDLRQFFKEDNFSKAHNMKRGHKERFLERLEKEMPKAKSNKPSFMFLKIAAVAIIVLGVAAFLYQYSSNTIASQQVVDNENVTPAESKKASNQITLGDLSPDLKLVENYYITNINLELAEIEISKENQQVINGFMDRLTVLNDEYQNLTKELNQIGPNEQTVAALIKNLELRLQLLYQLREKLNEFKTTKNETIKNQQI